MHLTRRGYGALAVVAVGAVMAWAFGARALNAVVAPIAVALAVGAIQVWQTDAPTVARTPPAPVGPDERRSVAFEVNGTAGTNATVTDAVAAPLSVVDATPAEAGAVTVETTLPATIRYDVTAAARGRHELGPVEVAVRDALGLVASRRVVRETSDLVVYPRVSSLADGALGTVYGSGGGYVTAGAEFDGIRAYRPGDPLRHVDWKTSAKRPGDLYVATYRREHGGDDFVIGLARTADESLDDGAVDGLASGAASLIAAALDTGYRVGLATDDEIVAPRDGSEHRARLLERLAVLSAEEVPTRPPPEADVTICARGQSFDVVGDRRSIPFAELRSDAAAPRPTAEGTG